MTQSEGRRQSFGSKLPPLVRSYKVEDPLTLEDGVTAKMYRTRSSFWICRDDLQIRWLVVLTTDEVPFYRPEWRDSWSIVDRTKGVFEVSGAMLALKRTQWLKSETERRQHYERKAELDRANRQEALDRYRKQRRENEDRSRGYSYDFVKWDPVETSIGAITYLDGRKKRIDELLQLSPRGRADHEKRILEIVCWWNDADLNCYVREAIEKIGILTVQRVLTKGREWPESLVEWLNSRIYKAKDKSVGSFSPFDASTEPHRE